MSDEDEPSPEELRWRWEQPVPLRWLLIDEYTMGQPDRAVAVCTEIDGLFVDPPPAPVERYTLLGCVPVGRLRAAVDGTGAAWLGNVVLDVVQHADRTPAGDRDPAPVGCRAGTEELLDLTVVGHRPSALAPGRVDVDLEGRIRTEPSNSRRLLAEPPDAVGYRLTGGVDEKLGNCLDVAGVFRQRPEPPTQPVTLRGCRPEAPLRAALDALRRGAGSPGGALHRRRLTASIFSVTVDGTPVSTLGAGVHGSVTAVRPSALGEGLLDVSFDTGVAPMPEGARRIWEQWRAGPPRERGEWADHDRELRHQWAGAALCHRRRPAADRPGGTTYHLDGRHVTDVEGFYCAMGEAVNGPGGYFGWNLDALDDCLRGGWGAAPPFRLVWHDAAVARAHLAAGYDRRRWAPAVTLDDLLALLAARGVEVELR